MNNNYLNYIEEFASLYKNRPISNNDGGMKFPHMFATYCFLKELNPKLVLESGVWHGQGTWLIEKALPHCKIISMDPQPGVRRYNSPNASYTTDDITSIDWGQYLENENLTPSEVVVFLDDHQNVLNRLRFLKVFNLHHILYEDNYPPNQGDCLSLKKLKIGGDYIIDTPRGKYSQTVSDEDFNYFKSIVDTYTEFPPIVKPEHTRWGDLWEDTTYPTLPPLYQQTPEFLKEFEHEFKDYTWFCYLKLN
jgi:hypothetical protein